MNPGVPGAFHLLSLHSVIAVFPGRKKGGEEKRKVVLSSSLSVCLFPTKKKKRGGKEEGGEDVSAGLTACPRRS